MRVLKDSCPNLRQLPTLMHEGAGAGPKHDFGTFIQLLHEWRSLRNCATATWSRRPFAILDPLLLATYPGSFTGQLGDNLLDESTNKHARYGAAGGPGVVFTEKYVDEDRGSAALEPDQAIDGWRWNDGPLVSLYAWVAMERWTQASRYAMQQRRSCFSCFHRRVGLFLIDKKREHGAEKSRLSSAGLTGNCVI